MKTPHQRLVEALTVERYDHTWWDGARGGPDTPENQEARRNRLDAAWQAHNTEHPGERPGRTTRRRTA